jgi:probable F420-dependent oxidoreductase
LKFGVYLHPPGGSGDPKDIVALAQGAERLPFDSVWIGDHVVWPAEFDSAPHHRNVGGKTPPAAVVNSNVFEPLTTLAFLAARVERVKLGIGVLVAPYRNPILTAKMLAMLDVLSEGRLIVGVGAGWLREEFDVLEAPPYERRGAVTDDYLRSFVELWTQPTPDFQGRYGRVSRVLLNPKPVQKPHPPIWIGGNGTPAIRRAVSYGTGWMPLHQTPEDMAAKVGQLQKIAQVNGRNPADITVSLGCRFRFSDGPVDPDSLVGTTPQVLDQLRRYQESGVDEVHLLNDGYRTVAELLGALDRFATEVISEV